MEHLPAATESTEPAPSLVAALTTSPWGWRTGRVLSVSARLTCIEYDAPPATCARPTGIAPLAEPSPSAPRAIVWHPAPLDTRILPGDVVALHEGLGVLQHEVGLAVVHVEVGLGPVPTPVEAPHPSHERVLSPTA